MDIPALVSFFRNIGPWIKTTLLRSAAYAKAHVFIATAVALVVLGGGYYAYGTLTSTAGETRYVLGAADEGAIVSSITATGQMSSSNQIDLKPKASGEVLYVGVTNGQQVRTGQLIASLDATDAAKAVRDAEINLQSAQLSLQKLGAAADALTVTQSQNAVSQAQDDLSKVYDSSFTTISNTYIDLPALMTGINDVLLYGATSNRSGQANIDLYTDLIKNYVDTAPSQRDDVEAKYKAAQDAYTAALIDYKVVTRFSDRATIDKSIDETLNLMKLIATSIKTTNDYLSFVKDTLTARNSSIPAQLTAGLASLSTYTTQSDSHLSDLSSAKTTIASDIRSVAEKQQSLAKLQSGADPIDLTSQQLSVEQRQNALTDAKATLSNYYVYAPFDGTIAALPVKKYDTASSGTSVATLITSQKIATLSLNEVDAAKVKVGQKATLTFDAIDGLTLTGKVVTVDTLGTVSQNVVSYSMQIALDSQDDRVKPGMSVSASIITDSHQDVVRVPSSAVKAQNGIQYVEVLDGQTDTSATGVASTVAPRRVTVTTGLSDDSNIEILTGLKAGDLIVVRSITAAAQKATTASAPSILGGGARGGAGGATTRALGR